MSVIITDVIIAGGGLAGLGLAHQLISKRPELKIVVLERNTFPVDDTTAKVGESTVEIASRYLCHTLGLSEHFKDKHLQKFGLRCFFGGPQQDFSQLDELGVSQRFALPTYQLERGVLENHLYQELLQKGVTIDHGVSIQDVDMATGNHTVSLLDQNQQPRRYRSRWLLDCAGRFGLVKRHLNLQKPSPHRCNAVWFRVDKTIKIDDWSDNQDWQQRMQLPGKRWLSTNHLMGAGYWVWIIPLGSGATSIGVVMDDTAFDQAALSDYDAALNWLSRHHPQCADALSDAKLLDYVVLKDFSYDCKQVFSEQGWGLSGEAGVFADPFYSPGSDFIALANEILSHLVVEESRGQNIGFDLKVLEIFFNSFFANTLSLYTGQYGGFGDRVMMACKLLWDYCFYWGILALLYYRDAVTDVMLLRDVNPLLLKALALNNDMQQRFRERAQQRQVLTPSGTFIDQHKIPVLHQLIDQLNDDTLPLQQALPTSLSILEQVSPLLATLLQHQSEPASEHEINLLGEFRRSVLA